MVRIVTAVRKLGGVLIDPVSTVRDARDREGLADVWPLAIGVAAVLGVATLPRQLGLLHELFPVVEDAVSGHQAAMRAGLARLIVADRLIVAPAVLVSGVILSLALDGVLGLPANRRRRVWAVVGLGLAPLLLERVGELFMTYLVSGQHLSPGDVVGLPHRFTTGPRLAWGGSEPPPAWLEVLDARVSLVTLWTAALWGLGIRELDRAARFEPWHVALPLACLAAGGLLTWALGPMAAALTLRLG